MFCIFSYFEEEKETGYNRKFYKKKSDLFNSGTRNKRFFSRISRKIFSYPLFLSRAEDSSTAFIKSGTDEGRIDIFGFFKKDWTP